MRDKRSKCATFGRGSIPLAMAVVLITTTVALGAGRAAAATTPAEPSFGALTKQVGVGGSDVATGDVDGDGDLDLADVNQFPPGISLLLGNGDGTFADQVVYPTPEFGRAIGFADLNGDGSDDVVVTGSTTGVSVLMANGDGTLAPAVSYPLTGAGSLALEDVNGDQNVDVLVSIEGSAGGVSLLAGNGDGTLGTPTSVYSVSGGTGAIAIGDVNNDSIPDLVTADSSLDVLRVLFGDGHGSFTRHTLLSIFGARHLPSVLLSDLNGDGDLDVVTVDDLQDQVSILLGSGDGSFGSLEQFDAGARSIAVAAGDLNLDGFPDLVVVDAFSFARLFLGRGDGTFVQSPFAPGGSTISVATGDFNGDSALDFAVGSRQSTQTTPDFVRVLVNTTNLALDRPTAVCSDGQATVSWTAPAGASVVTGYTVTPFIGYIERPSTTFNSTATTQTLTGLANGTEYRFKISALNAVGAGPRSQVSNPVTPAPAPSVPDSPKLPKAIAGDGAATVSWNPPSNGCVPIMGYVVTPFDGSSPLPPQTFNSADRTQTIIGLTNGVSYRFRIQAFNAIGTGAMSNQSNAVTPVGP